MWCRDRDRLGRARAGDETAFRELVDPYRAELQLHCYRILGSLQDAEDAVQETLLAAWRGLRGFEERASLRVLALPDRDQPLSQRASRPRTPPT
jgi:RNA polymerase sigma-70 factor (ECF subfamily)